MYARMIGVLSEPPVQVSYEEFKKLKDPDAAREATSTPTPGDAQSEDPKSPILSSEDVKSSETN